MRKVLAVLVVSVALVTLSLGATAPAGIGPAEPASISVTEGVVGTTVTVTGTDCGDLLQGLRANGGADPTPYEVGSGVLIVTVPGWPEPFPSGFEGGTNDVNGVATATFQVPDVPLGAYPITAECQATGLNNVTPGLGSEAAPYAIGPYPGTLTFTVIAPTATVPVVEAQATTTG